MRPAPEGHRDVSRVGAIPAAAERAAQRADGISCRASFSFLSAGLLQFPVGLIAVQVGG